MGNYYSERDHDYQLKLTRVKCSPIQCKTLLEQQYCCGAREEGLLNPPRTHAYVFIA